MGDPSVQDGTKLSLRKSSFITLSRCWTEVGLNGEMLPLSKLLFSSMALNLSLEHDPPWSRAETFSSSSGQKSNSPALYGENRGTPEATELGEVQDSHTGKVQLVVGVKKGSVWTTQWSDWTGVCLWIQVYAHSTSSDLAHCQASCRQSLCFMVWDSAALWLGSLREVQVMQRKQEERIQRNPSDKGVLGLWGTASIKVAACWSPNIILAK